jgi:uncharacterized RDD family membrane protein YckC
MEQQNVDSSADSGRRSSAIVISKDDLMTVAPPKPAASPRPVLAPQPSPEPEPAPFVTSVPAGFWLRFLAKVLDLAVAAAVFIIGGAAVGALVWFGCMGMPLPAWQAVRPVLPRMAWQLFAVYVCFYCLYSVTAHAANGRSIGKAICRIRVVSTKGAGVSVFSSLLYFVARFMVSTMSLLLLGVGHALAGFRADKCALSDLVVGSHVVKEMSKRP